MSGSFCAALTAGELATKPVVYLPVGCAICHWHTIAQEVTRILLLRPNNDKLL